MYVSQGATDNAPVIIECFLPFVVFTGMLDPDFGGFLPSSRAADDMLLGRMVILLGDDVAYSL